MPAKRDFSKVRDDYIQVDQRIQAFLAKWPEGRIVTQNVDFHVEEYVYITVKSGDAPPREMPALRGWVLVEACAYRGLDDPQPGKGWSMMIMPGGTPYTRGSELENCETSAWGRAIAATGIEVRGGITTAEDIRNKLQEDTVSVSITSSGAPQAARGGYAPLATTAQITTIGGLAREVGMAPDELWKTICDLNPSVPRETMPADGSDEEKTRLIKVALKGLPADEAGKVIVTLMALKAAAGEPEVDEDVAEPLEMVMDSEEGLPDMPEASDGDAEAE